MGMTRARVLLCDDNELVRRGVRALLESDLTIEVIGEASTADEAVAAVAVANPDVVVLDVSTGMEPKVRIELTAYALPRCSLRRRPILNSMEESLARYGQCLRIQRCRWSTVDTSRQNCTARRRRASTAV